MSKGGGCKGKSSVKKAEDALTRSVREFYEEFHFPRIRPLEQDGLILMRRIKRIVSDRSSSRNPKPLRVLDAGCGTGNTLISLARQAPSAEFLGVDISGPSLNLAEESARACGLENVRFREWNLIEPIPNEDPFDTVLCLGVLHHTSDMELVLSNLRGISARDGELYLWVYGRYGRYRHTLNRRLLRILQKSQPETRDPIETVIDFVENTAEGAALKDLKSAIDRMAGDADLLLEPAWLADQFLHPHEELLDMEGLISLVGNSGFEVSEWLGVDDRPETHFSSSALIDRFLNLPHRERLVALDLLLKPDRYFVLLRQKEAAGVDG
jgi:SAM-dependent methyltransferase